MKAQKILAFVLVSITSMTACAQGEATWDGKKCAVALTYDDALDVHLNHAVPVLDSFGLKATFYISGYSGAFRIRLNEWRRAAANGHELGNHTLFHPCTGGRPGREFVTPDYDLRTYSLRRIHDEIEATNTVLHAADGKTKRTFAYPCGDTQIGDSPYIQTKSFIAARGVKAEMLQMTAIDPYHIGCYVINGQTGEELIALVKKAMQENALLVFLFHGVGGGHSLNVSLSAHRQLLQFLHQNRNAIRIAPLIELAEYAEKYKTLGNGGKRAAP